MFLRKGKERRKGRFKGGCDRRKVMCQAKGKKKVQVNGCFKSEVV